MCENLLQMHIRSVCVFILTLLPIYYYICLQVYLSIIQHMLSSGHV